MVELSGANFRLMVVILRVLNEFIPTLNREDPKY